MQGKGCYEGRAEPSSSGSTVDFGAGEVTHAWPHIDFSWFN